MEYDSGSNIFVREMLFGKSGTVIEGHAHNFDHTTYVVKGAIRVEKLDVLDNILHTVTVEAGPRCWLLIRAGVKHRLKSLTPDTVAHCIYAHRDAQGKITQRHDGWEKSYG